jgi:hypothetical protein
MKHTAWWPDHITRFFKKGAVNWGNTIHAAPIRNGRLHQLPAHEKNALVHYNYNSIEDILLRTFRYTQNEPYERAEAMKSIPDVYDTINGDFHWRYIEKEGYKDGVHGYVMSEFMRLYRFLIFLKYWEDGGYKPLGGSQKLYHRLSLVSVPPSEAPSKRSLLGRLIERLRNTHE